jgi:Ca2+/Na+ antiporter
MFAGTILLAISTSLPEIATTVTATPRGNVDMAVNNLGAVALNPVNAESRAVN